MNTCISKLNHALSKKHLVMTTRTYYTNPTHNSRRLRIHHHHHHYRCWNFITTTNNNIKIKSQQKIYYTTTTKSNFEEEENQGSRIHKILQNVKDGTLELSEAEKLIINTKFNQRIDDESTTSSSSSKSSSKSKQQQDDDENSILTSFATLDYNRQSRTGFPEVVFGQGKTPQQIVTILDDFARHQQKQVETNKTYNNNNNNNSSSSSSSSSNSNDTTTKTKTLQQPPKAILATRVTRDVYEEIIKLPFKYGTIQYHEIANIISMIPTFLSNSSNHNNNNEEQQQQQQGETTFEMKKHVAVVTAGTTDLPIAEEASITLESAGCHVVRVVDVGVAGLHRIITALPKLRHPNVGCIIVVAGMDGALPSVVGGLVDVPVIAVPTSIGYGVSLGGISAMLTMLNSCAPGVGVVNIDNGFGAAALAYKFIRSHQK